MQERKLYVLNEPIPEEPATNAPRAQRDTYIKHRNYLVDIKCLMLATMESELQKQMVDMEAFTMMARLKEMFQEQARIERFATIKALLSCKMVADISVSPHVLKMKGYLDHLEKLNLSISQELATDIILQTLPDAFDSFFMNCNMHNMEKTIYELNGMLKTVEQNIKTTSNVMMVKNCKGKDTKRKWVRKGKAKDNKKPKPNPSPDTKGKKPKTKQPKAKEPKEGQCFFYNEPSHWKRNCKLYLKDLKKKMGSETTTSGIYVIEINLSTFVSWVLDTGCGSHICVNVQGLKNSRSLVKGEVDLRVGNGARVAALAVGTYYLSLPSGLVLELDNCYYVPTMSRNIISISYLDMVGFSFIIKNNTCSIYYGDIFYGDAHLSNCLYILNHDNPNAKSIYNINTKRFRSNDLNTTYLWHCCLGHTNEKRISKPSRWTFTFIRF